MRKAVLLATMVISIGANACSCFGPSTFCETLDPSYSESQWWLPSDVVMAVVVGNEAYGVDVRIARVFAGSLEVDREIRVWGDCGALCRRYVTGMTVGDTVVWALQPTDLSGNVICGTELESQGEYQLSVCGVYALAYDSGQVSGPITSELGNETMDLDELEQLVQGCLSTGIRELEADPLMVRYGPEGTTLSLNASTSSELVVYDATGRTSLTQRWDGTPLSLVDLSTGIYMVAVLTGKQRWIRKVFVP